MFSVGSNSSGLFSTQPSYYNPTDPLKLFSHQSAFTGLVSVTYMYQSAIQLMYRPIQYLGI